MPEHFNSTRTPFLRAPGPRGTAFRNRAQELREHVIGQPIDPGVPGVFRQLAGALPFVPRAELRPFQRKIGEGGEGFNQEEFGRFNELSDQEKALVISEQPEFFADLKSSEFDALFGIEQPQKLLNVPQGGSLFDPESREEVFSNRPDPSPKLLKFNIRDLQSGKSFLTTESEAVRLIVEDPRRYEAVIEKGGITINQGLQPATLNKIEDSLRKVGDSRDRLIGISQSFRPEFATLVGKISAGRIRFQDALQGVPGVPGVTDQEREFLNDFTENRTKLSNEMNLVINALSGAAVSPQEFDRLKKNRPNEDDGPIEAAKKLQVSMTEANIFIARYQMWLDSGARLQPWNLTRNDVLEAMDRRIQQVFEQLKQTNPEIDSRAAISLAKRQAEEDFSMTPGSYQSIRRSIRGDERVSPR